MSSSGTKTQPKNSSFSESPQIHRWLESIAGKMNPSENNLLHEQQKYLIQILSGPCHLTDDGFPAMSPQSFDLFLQKIPHLFVEGQKILNFLRQAETASHSSFVSNASLPPESLTQLSLNISAIRTLVLTAAVTSPSDLWLTFHLLVQWQELGLIESLQKKPQTLTELASSHKLTKSLLQLDVDFLLSRHILEFKNDQFSFRHSPQWQEITTWLKSSQGSAALIPSNPVPVFKKIFSGDNLSAEEKKLLEDFFKLPIPVQNPKRQSWPPTLHEIFMGAQLMSLILGLRVANLTQKMIKSLHIDFPENLPFRQNILFLLQQAGLIDEQNMLTDLGARVFDRGPGPFGIIHAYHPYVETHLTQLQGTKTTQWVSRAANVAASQDANRKSFKMILESLARYVKDTGFQYKVFIEHALGQGEATRQHFNLYGEKTIQYFGADLEDASIAQAKEQKALGHLPTNLQFISQADIGVAEVVIDAITKAGFSCHGAVMVVGNGFHEIRHQTDEKMTACFRKYADAGILIIFTEETAISTVDLQNSAWNSFHAAFRYFHELSGQGLRHSHQHGQPPRVLSWKECAEGGGYQVLEKYTSHTRSLFPFRQDSVSADKQTAISVNYFCVPKTR